MKKLLFTTLLLTSSFLQASIFPAHSNPIPTSTRLAQIDPNEGLLTPQQVQQTAKSISVRITSANNGGSGVLIAQKGGNYLVLTNAHVVRRATQLEIQAPDGQKYQAKPIDGGFSSKYDLALLQFTSKTKYALAQLMDKQGRPPTPLDPERTIYSAGFPFDSKEIRITQGQVSQLTDIPFDDGTQIGYTIDQGNKGIRQGMSGGAIFDAQGNFLGINTIGVAPILPDYRYNDGSKPIAKLKDLYARANWGIPVYNFLTNVKAEILYGYDNLPKVEHQVTPTGFMAELNDKKETRKKTVRIENSGSTGSGVIVASEGSTYYVLTAKHVVQDEKYNTHRKFTDGKIVTYDQDAHPVTSIVVAEGVDLAVIKFTSTSNYPVAKLGKYSTKDEDLVFVGGFPDRGDIKSPLWQWQLNPGYISSRESGKLRTQDGTSFATGGYDLIYGSISYGGMSGGPVFDTAGNVIGIHGEVEKAGLNSLGISIQTFIGLATKLQVTPNLAIDPNHPSNLTPADRSNVIAAMQNISPPQAGDSGEQWLNYGNQLYRTRQNDKSIAAFDRAIAKDKKLVLAANYGKALVLHRAKKFDLATTAIAQAIAAAPIDRKERTNYYYLWNWQSVILRRRYKFDEAIRSIDFAIGLKPDDLNLRHEKVANLMSLGRNKEGIAIESEIIQIKPEWHFYMIRASMKLTLGDTKGTLEDQNTAIKLNPDHENSYVARAHTKSEIGDKKGAIEDVDRASRLNPNSDSVYRARARLKSDAGDNEGAMKDIDRAIQIAPEDASTYSVRADIKDELKNYDGAIEDLNRAIQIDPYYINAYVDRGRSKSKSGDKQGAIADLTKALEIDPNFYLAYTLRIIVKADIGDNKGIIEDCSKALKLKSKDDASYYFFRAHAKAELGDNKGAIEDYSKAIELTPKKASLYSFRGRVKLKLGDKQGAIADFTQAIKIDPKDAPGYSARGNIKSELDDKQGAIGDLTKAIELEPKDAAYPAIRGEIKSKHGDKQGALLDLNRAIELNPKYTLAYGLRGDIKLGLGDKQGAIDDYTQAIKLNPKFAGAYNMRGFVKSDLGNKREAILDYDKAIELNPKYADAYINRSVAKFELGDNTGAIVDTEKAIVLNPNSALAYANRGDFLIIDNKEREALPNLERAIKLDPKMSYAYAGRGIVRETLGDKQGAISDYKQAVKLNPQILTEWTKQAESVGKYNPASYQKYQQMIQKLEAGSKLN
jgi:tetratricopeptide (TPR) repeat protein/S1-C subfamily serine protease